MFGKATFDHHPPVILTGFYPRPAVTPALNSSFPHRRESTTHRSFLHGREFTNHRSFPRRRESTTHRSFPRRRESIYGL